MAINPYGPMPINPGTTFFGKQDNSSQAGGSYLDMPQIAAQKYIPLGKKRDLSTDEQKKVDKGLNQWFPTLFASYSTPITSLLASPGKDAVLSSLVTIGLGGLLTLLSSSRNKGLYAIGTAALALIVGIGSYFGRRQQNDNILDIMKRLPPDSTKRDLLADPAYQADLDRRAQRQHNHSYYC
jgi:hypothetical protein